MSSKGLHPSLLGDEVTLTDLERRILEVSHHIRRIHTAQRYARKMEELGITETSHRRNNGNKYVKWY